MLETRLVKRARALGFDSLAGYCQYIHTPEGKSAEWSNVIDAVTTHKTDFFREAGHFDFLVERALPELVRCCGAGVRRPLLAWSSACSTGQEPYTLALVLSRFAAGVPEGGFRFRVFGSDISQPVLEAARSGVYPESAADPIPKELRHRYVLRSRDRERQMVRMSPEIRASVEFRIVNLNNENYGWEERMDVVFCRNVMIYFERATQQRVLTRIAQTLVRGGYLFMGHSESLNGLALPLVQVAPTVYRRLDE